MEQRVLFVASTFSHIANFHLPYVRAFLERGWKVDIACGGEYIPIAGADKQIELPFEKSMSSPKNLKAAFILRNIMPRYALMSVHTSLAAFFARTAALGLRQRPFICNTAHGYLFDDKTPAARRAVLAMAEKLTAPVTDMLMTMNDWDHEYACAHSLGKRIVNIPGMGVDFSKADIYGAEDAAAHRSELGFDDSCFVMTYAAEFSERKNQSLLIRAMTMLPERAVLVLPGKGALREECIALAAELGLADRVLFPGQVNNVPLWYLASDAAVSSSRSEGLPFNIMEAMHCSLPVVASAVKGHTDLICDGQSGLLYPYGDGAAFAGCIRRIMEDKAFAAGLGTAAKCASDKYALDHVLPKVMENYDLVL